MATVAGKQVKLFLVDGTFGGLVTAEIMGWTGHVLKGRRSQLDEINDREESQRTGVYILLGSNDSGEDLAYIGETDNIAARLKQHNAHKQFWDEVIIITSKDSNLTSAHARYIEAHLIRRANELKRIPLENGNEPTGGAGLPEADVAYMDAFIEQALTLLPVLGVDMFRGREKALRSQLSASVGDSPIFLIKVKNHGGEARAQIVDGEFTVLEGSDICPQVSVQSGAQENTKRQAFVQKILRERLRMSGAIVDGADEHSAILTQDIQFSSPSAAAAFVQGRATANGRTGWATAEGITFGAWESRG